MQTNDQNTLSCVIIEPTTPATHSIIWLHGLGADGNDFAPIAPELRLPTSLAVRFIFPHAPIMPVTINLGMTMRAWFDIYAAQIDAKIDMAGIQRSVHAIETLIAHEEANGIPSSNIILAGFSQGAVIALTTLLTCHKPLAGAIALSGFLPNIDTALEHTSTANHTTPIFIAHGTADTIVPYALGESSYTALKQAGYPVTWHSYPMPHSVCADEITDISRWIVQQYNLVKNK